MDAYETWLREQVELNTKLCLGSAAEIGYPGGIRFAEQALRERLEAYEDCLEEYQKFKGSPTPPDAEA